MSQPLVRYDAAIHALAECRHIDDAKDIADKALALQTYARQSKDPQMEAWVAEIRLRARRKVGNLSAALPAIGHRPGKGSELGTLPKKNALKAAGLSKAEAHRCELLARVPEAAFEAYIAMKMAARKAVTADEVMRMVGKRKKKTSVAGTADLTTVKTSDLVALSSRGLKFGTILADPPWLYGNQLVNV